MPEADAQLVGSAEYGIDFLDRGWAEVLLELVVDQVEILGRDGVGNPSSKHRSDVPVVAA